MSLRALLRRETFSRRWTLWGLFKRIFSSSSPRRSKPEEVEIDLPVVAPTPPTTPTEEGGSVGFFPGLSLPHEGLLDQVGEGSKLSMMPRRSPRRNYGIPFLLSVR